MNRKAIWVACGLAVLGLAGLGLGSTAVSQEGVEFDTDFYGNDYQEMPLRPGEGYEICARACADDQRCHSWSWVPQGMQRAEGPNCWLKDRGPDRRQLTGVVSAMRGYGVTRVSQTGGAPTYGTGSYAGTGTAASVQPQLVLFEGDNFGGRAVRLNADASNLHLQSLEFGDSTWSLAAQGRWLMCADIEYGGDCRIYEGDHAQMADFGGTISSVRYLGPGASSAVLGSQMGSGQGGNGAPASPYREPSATERAAQDAARRAGQAAADEAERRVHDRIREGIGRLF